MSRREKSPRTSVDHLYGCLIFALLFITKCFYLSFVNSRMEGVCYCSYFIQIVHAISVLMIWLLSIYLYLLSVPRWFKSSLSSCRTMCEWWCSYIGSNSISLPTGRVSQKQVLKQNLQRLMNVVRKKSSMTQKWL